MGGTQLTGSVQVVSQALFDIAESAGQQNLGEVVYSNDGRTYRYAAAGATLLVVGNLLQTAAQVTGNQNVAVAAAALGTTAITTTGTVTLTANQLAEGYAMISVTPGLGYSYAISSNPAVTSAVVTVNLKDQIQVALTTSSTVSFFANAYNGVIQNPTTATGSPVGVAVSALPATYFGWIQTRGPSAVLIDGSITVGLAVVPSAGTAGAVKSNAGNQPQIGSAMQTETSTDVGAVMLTIE